MLIMKNQKIINIFAIENKEWSIAWLLIGSKPSKEICIYGKY